MPSSRVTMPADRPFTLAVQASLPVQDVRPQGQEEETSTALGRYLERYACGHYSDHTAG